MLYFSVVVNTVITCILFFFHETMSYNLYKELILAIRICKVCVKVYVYHANMYDM